MSRLEPQLLLQLPLFLLLLWQSYGSSSSSVGLVYVVVEVGRVIVVVEVERWWWLRGYVAGGSGGAGVAVRDA